MEEVQVRILACMEVFQVLQYMHVHIKGQKYFSFFHQNVVSVSVLFILIFILWFLQSWIAREQSYWDISYWLALFSCKSCLNFYISRLERAQNQGCLLAALVRSVMLQGIFLQAVSNVSHSVYHKWWNLGHCRALRVSWMSVCAGTWVWMNKDEHLGGHREHQWV